MRQIVGRGKIKTDLKKLPTVRDYSVQQIQFINIFSNIARALSKLLRLKRKIHLESGTTSSIRAIENNAPQSTSFESTRPFKAFYK